MKREEALLVGSTTSQQSHGRMTMNGIQCMRERRDSLSLSRCRTYQSVVFHSSIPASLFSIRPLCVQYVQAHFLDFFQCKQKHTHTHTHALAHRPTRVKSPKARERWIPTDNNVLSPHSPSCMSTSAWMNGWSSMHARRYRRRNRPHTVQHVSSAMDANWSCSWGGLSL
jgi:hypothetical protein